MNVLTELKNRDDFSSNEKIIVDYILERPSRILEMNTDQLKKECMVSTSAIYRLCDKLGVKGFNDLKIQISSSLQDYSLDQGMFDFDYPVKQDWTNYEVFTRLKEDYEQTLVSTMNMFNLTELKLSVSALLRAKVIDIFTSAGNVYFAENFRFQMAEIGVKVNVPVDEYEQRLIASSSNETHVAIIISFGGRGLLMEQGILPSILKQRKTPIILISSPEYGHKADFATYRLSISPYENHYNKISSFSTRLSILYILDTLYTCYFQKEYDSNIQKKLEYYSLISGKFKD